jgi:hypothetical protein
MRRPSFLSEKALCRIRNNLRPDPEGSSSHFVRSAGEVGPVLPLTYSPCRCASCDAEQWPVLSELTVRSSLAH